MQIARRLFSNEIVLAQRETLLCLLWWFETEIMDSWIDNLLKHTL